MRGARAPGGLGPAKVDPRTMKHCVYTWILAAALSMALGVPAIAQPSGVYPRLLCDNAPVNLEDCQVNGLSNPFQNLDLQTPFQGTLSPNLQHLYVVNFNSDNYSILSVGNPSEVSSLKNVNLDQGCFPVDLAIVADKLFVGCFGPDLLGTRTEEGRLEVFTKNQLGTYEVRGPRIELDPDPGVPDTDPFTSVTGITSSADGKFLYVAMILEDSCGPFRIRFGSVAVVRTDNYTISDQFPHTSTCGRPGNQELLEPLDIVRSPDGRKLYVSLHASTPPDVAVLNVSPDGSTIPGSSYDHIPLCSTQGCNDPSDEDAKNPAALLLSPDGSKLYVTHNGQPVGDPRFRISVANTASRTVTSRINLPSSGSQFIDYNPTLPVYTSDLTKILVPLYGDNDNLGDHVAVINAATDTLDLAATIPIPRSRASNLEPIQTAQPIAIVVHPAQPFAYVLNSVPDTIAVLRTVPPPVPELGPLALVAALVLLGLRLHRRKTQGVGSRA